LVRELHAGNSQKPETPNPSFIHSLRQKSHDKKAKVKKAKVRKTSPRVPGVSLRDLPSFCHACPLS
jgi:hypothetical protein